MRAPVGLYQQGKTRIETMSGSNLHDVHVNYESAVLRIRDGFPKMKDFPADMGGSGATLPE